MHTYSSFSSPYLQQYLDEAIWRRKFKPFKSRVDFIVQLNSFANYQTDEGFETATDDISKKILGGEVSDNEEELGDIGEIISINEKGQTNMKESLQLANDNLDEFN